MWLIGSTLDAKPNHGTGAVELKLLGCRRTVAVISKQFLVGGCPLSSNMSPLLTLIEGESEKGRESAFVDVGGVLKCFS